MRDVAEGAVGDFVADDTGQLIVGGQQLHQPGADVNFVVLVDPTLGTFPHDFDGVLAGTSCCGASASAIATEHRFRPGLHSRPIWIDIIFSAATRLREHRHSAEPALRQHESQGEQHADNDGSCRAT